LEKSAHTLREVKTIRQGWGLYLVGGPTPLELRVYYLKEVLNKVGGSIDKMGDVLAPN